MTIIEMLEQSGILSLLGMAVVFGFLAILVIIISLVGKIINPKGIASDASFEASGIQTGSPAAAPQTNNNSLLTAVITAAVTQYRKRH